MTPPLEPDPGDSAPDRQQEEAAIEEAEEESFPASDPPAVRRFDS